jgi:hypothetical protein
MSGSSFNRLFTPIVLRGRKLRNRIVFGAHTANMAVGGLPTEQHAAYYAERAIGGAAMIVVEPMPVHAAAVLTRGNFRHSDDSVVPAFRKVTDAIRSNGAVAIQQLYHVGQHSDADNSFHPGWSPSGLPSYHDSDGSHRMTEAEIEETIEGFVQAARRCYEALVPGGGPRAIEVGMITDRQGEARTESVGRKRPGLTLGRVPRLIARFLHDHVGVDVDLGRSDTLAAQPERDD